MNNFFKHFKVDALGGITAGIVALPLALAFGVSSGLGPSAGLYGAIFISFFAALFGGTNTQISGPTAPMTALSITIVAGIVGTFDGDVNKALPAILMVFLLAGLIQVVLGIVGFGKYIKYIPYPVVSGFMTAIGVMILFTQILPALGYYPGEDQELAQQFVPQAEDQLLNKILNKQSTEGILILDNFAKTQTAAAAVTDDDIEAEAKSLAAKKGKSVVGAIGYFPRAFNNINWLELALCLATIAIIYGFKKITTKVPSTLVALLVVSAVAIFAGLNYRPINEIPSGFPTFRGDDIIANFSFAAIKPYFFTAISLAFLGAIDSLLTSVVADNMTKTKHKPNKELIGQGIGNTIGSLFGGLPGAGATIRTVVNIKAGGKTRLSGMIAGVLLLTILLALGPIASKIPAAVLAGILITVGIGVMDYKGLKAIPDMHKDVDLKIFKLSSEVVIMLVVLVLSVVWDLVAAVGVGLVLASLAFMKKMGDFTADVSKVTNLKETNAKEPLWNDERTFPDRFSEEVYIKHLNGPLFFGYTSDFQALAKQIPKTASHVILRMDKVPYIDQSGLYTLEDVLLDLERRDVHTLLINPQKQPLMMLQQIDIVPDLISQDRIFEDFDACIAYIEKNVRDIH
ncbi:SulP family inorganic anion transporter [Spongiivirga sp. MCCC 1A20706]|uniref:SulP family inorganic anion transporter n=1 Tax=Spongiivirga sp. MCCC 1A20706 TaxID=3160963 RepID=UPI003977DB14